MPPAPSAATDGASRARPHSDRAAQRHRAAAAPRLVGRTKWVVAPVGLTLWKNHRKMEVLWDLMGFYGNPLVIKYGTGKSLRNGSFHRKTIDFYGPFSSTPCLITGEYSRYIVAVVHHL